MMSLPPRAAIFYWGRTNLNAEYIPVLATAVSLAMDAFSVSICIGLCQENLRFRDAFSLGAAFGIFQFLMPLIGAEGAEHLKGFLNAWTPWIAAALIVWVALNMIKEAGQNSCAKESTMSVTFRNVIVLAFATSLDALAVGFSIQSTGGSAWFLAIAAGIVTFVLPIAGALGGKALGSKVGQRAEYLGGAVLFLIAIKIVWPAAKTLLRL
jgi:putative Mn2+ efflux pump MntP